MGIGPGAGLGIGPGAGLGIGPGAGLGDYEPGAGLGDYEPGAGIVSGLRILPGIYILFDYCLIHFLPTQD